MNAPEHVALIGCGFTGTSAFYQLVDKYPIKKITIFEASGVYGPGYPYRSDECKDYLLNNTTDTLCLIPDNKRAFLNWMKTRPDLEPEVDERGNLPRVYYGYFLEDVFKTSLTNAAIKNIKVNLISEEVLNLSETKDKTVVVGWSEGSVEVDKVILTTGHCPSKDAYDKPTAESPVLYFPNHVNEKSLDNIAIDARVHILGASLSAFDVVGRLFSIESGCRFDRDGKGNLTYIAGNNKRDVILCSRSGRLKKMKSHKLKQIDRRHFTLEYLTSLDKGEGITLEDVAGAIKKDCALNGGDIDWQEIIDPYAECETEDEVNQKAASILEKDLIAAKTGGARNILVDIFGNAGIEIWDCFAAHLLSTDEEKKYRRKFETATLTYEASCPILTAEKLLALHRAGALKVIKGVDQVKFSKKDDAYIIDHEFGLDYANVLINTTGSVDRDVSSSAQPELFQNMISDGLLSPYQGGGTPMLGADVDMNNFRVTGTNNIHMANMMLWGPGFYTSGAIIMATIVDRILKSLFNE